MTIEKITAEIFSSPIENVNSKVNEIDFMTFLLYSMEQLNNGKSVEDIWDAWNEMKEGSEK